MDSCAYGTMYFMIILYSRAFYIWTMEVEVIYCVLLFGLPVMFGLEEIVKWLERKG